MQELQIFNYESKEIRTVEIGGNPWWVAKDVCDILELSDVSMSVSRLDEDEKGTSQIDTLGGSQNMVIINESGLYNLIIRSDKPNAKPFKKWITAEVLPSIRKTGQYSIQTNSLAPDIKYLNEKIDSMSKEITNFKNLLSEKSKPKTLDEIKSFFNVVNYSENQEYIIVEYCNKLFLVNGENYFTVFIKYKTDENVWDNNWHKLEIRLGSLKKGLEYILEMY